MRAMIVVLSIIATGCISVSSKNTPPSEPSPESTPTEQTAPNMETDQNQPAKQSTNKDSSAIDEPTIQEEDQDTLDRDHEENFDEG